MNDITQEGKEFKLESIPEPENIHDVVYALMANPNLSDINYFNDFSEQSISPESIGSSYTEETDLFETDINGARMAMSTHACHHNIGNDPQKAIEILISRAARKMLCSGITPVAVSTFLYHVDFADPNGQFMASGAKNGLKNAAKKFNLKISECKIRFDCFPTYKPVPTIIIGMAGLVENRNLVTRAFKKKGNNIFILGNSFDDLGSSEYLEFYHEIVDSPLPVFDIDMEVKIHEVLKKLSKMNLIESASPVSKGGLFFTLMRAAMPNGLGFDITSDAEIRLDSFLFGEAMGRIIVGVDPGKEDEFVSILTEMKMPFFALGHVTKGEIRIDDVSFGFIDNGYK